MMASFELESLSTAELNEFIQDIRANPQHNCIPFSRNYGSALNDFEGREGKEGWKPTANQVSCCS